MKCYKCGITERLTLLSRTTRKSGKTYTYYICSPCNKEKRRKNYQRNKATYDAYNAKYMAQHPNRGTAYYQAGTLPQKPCVICGEEPAQKHHPDYSKPKDIVYLCALHHKREHIRLKQLLG